MKRFDGETHIAPMLPPTDVAGAATTTSDWVCLSLYDSLTVVYLSDAGTAGEDATVSLRQATTAAGAGAKALAAGTWHAAQNASAASLGDTLEAAGAAGAGSFRDDGETAAVARVEVTGDQLDTAGDYSFVAVQLRRGGSTAGKIAAAAAVCRGGRYQAQIAAQPTALAAPSPS